ncbi:MAG: hypothetical protein ABSG33_09635 [Candidatus Bathyarchaeia archaeon]|jgi:hypothetical protein
MQKNMKILTILVLTIALFSISYLCVNQVKATAGYNFTVSYSVADSSTPTTAPTFTYVDYNTGAQVVSLTTSPTTYDVSPGSSWSISNPAYANSLVRWQTNNATLSGTASSDTVLDPTYYRQFYVTYYYTTSDSSTPSPAPRFSGYQYGVKTPFSFTASSQSVWLDATTQYSFDDPIYTPSLTEQWAVTNPATASGIVTGPITVTPEYWHQYYLTLSYSTSDNTALYGSPAVTFTADQFGLPVVTTLSTSTVNVWYDASSSGTAYSVTPVSVTGGSSDRYQLAPGANEGPITSAATLNFEYYHQYPVSLGYTTIDSSSITNGLEVGQYYQFGSLVTFDSAGTSGAGSLGSVWVDASTVSTPYSVYFYDVTASSGTERWFLVGGTTEYSISSSQTLTQAGYYHQYEIYFYYATNDNTAIPNGIVIGSYYQFGNTENIASTGNYYGFWGACNPYNDWVDAGTQITFSTVTAGSGVERWALSAGTESFSANTAYATTDYAWGTGFYHQYIVSFGYTTNDDSPLASQSDLVAYTQFGSTLYLSTDGSGVLSLSSDWADAGTAVTYVSPISINANERYKIAPADAGTNTVIVSVGSGAVTANPLYYHQVQNTFTVTGISGSDSVALTGTYFGTGSSTIVTLNTGNGWSTTAWSDYGYAVTFPATSTESTGSERWAIPSTASTGALTAGGGTYSEAYTHQFLVSFGYTTNDDSPLASQSDLVAYTQFGSTLYLSTDGSGVLSLSSDWADAGTAVTYVSPVSISVSERYKITLSDSGLNTVISSVGTGAVTANPEYYHQFMVNFGYTTVDSSNIESGHVIGHYYQFATLLTISSAAGGAVTPTSDWVNAGVNNIAYITVTATSTTERWALPSTYYINVQGSGSIGEPNYYHQYYVTFAYTTQDLSAIANNLAIGTFYQFGAPAGTIYATGVYGVATPTGGGWVDEGTGVRFNTAVATSGTEQWALVTSPDLTLTVTSAGTTTEEGYYHQFAFTLSYSTSDGSSATAPTLTSTQFGGAYTPTLTGTPTAYWLDNSKSWSVTNPLTGSTGSEQWATNQVVSGTVSATQTTAYLYYHQFMIDFGYTTSDNTKIQGTLNQGLRIGAYDQFGLSTSIYSAPGSGYGVTSPASDWVDSNSVTSTGTVTYLTSVSDSNTERWGLTSPDTTYVTGSTSITESGYVHQFLVSFGYTTNDLSPITNQNDMVTYTQFSNPMYLSTDGSGTLFLTSDWADAGTSVTYVSPIPIGLVGTEQYIITSGDSGINTVISSVGAGSMTANPEYYHQFSVIFQYSVTDGSPSAPTAYYTQFGVSQTVVAATDQHVIEWVDAGTSVSYDNPISASGTERWQADYTVSGGESVIVSSVSGSTLNIDPLYYHQFLVTFTYSVINGGLPADAPYAYFTQFGLSDNIQATGATAWVDNGSPITYDNPVADSTSSQRWQMDLSIDIYGQSLIGTISSSGTVNPGYYNQYSVTFGYSTQDGSYVPSGIIGQYSQFGSWYLITSDGAGAVSPSAATWVDAGSGNIAYHLLTASSTEHWATNTMIGGVDYQDVVGTGAYIESYYHQYLVTFTYYTSDSSSVTPPAVVYYQFGSAVIGNHATGFQDWADAASSVYYANPISISGTERYMVNLPVSVGYSVVDTVNGANYINPEYYHQYYVTLSYTTDDGSTIWDSSASSNLAIGYYMQFGSSVTLYSNPSDTYGVTSAGTTWLDAGYGNVWFGSAVASSGTEQWALVSDTPYSGYAGTYCNVLSSAPITESGYYHQYYIYFGYSTQDGSYTPLYTIIGSYTQFGSTQSITSFYGTVYGSSYYGFWWTEEGTGDWVDAAGSVSYYTITSGNERWALPPSAGTDTFSGVDLGPGYSVTGNYYDQMYVSFGYSVVNDITTPITSGNQIGSYYQFGSSTGVIDSTGTYGATSLGSDWVDIGSGTVSYSTWTNGANTERWALSTGTNNYDVTTSTTSVTESNYYHQFMITFGYTTKDGSTIFNYGNVPIGYYSQFGSSVTLSSAWWIGYGHTYTWSDGQYDQDWVDVGSNTVTYATYTNGGERWALSPSPQSYSVAPVAPTTTIIQTGYYHQFLVSFTYTTNDDTPIANQANMVTYTQFGNTMYLSTDNLGVLSMPSDWADINTAVLYNSPIMISSTERYMINAADVSTHIVIASVNAGAMTADPFYYHQFVITFGYASVNDIVNAIPSGNLIGSYYQFGSNAGNTILSGITYGSATPASAWVDTGSATVSYTTWTNGANTERWALLAGTNNYPVSSSVTIAEQNYYHQFKITFGYSVSNDASSVPSGLVIGNYTWFGNAEPITSTGVGNGVLPSVGTWVDAGARKVDYQTVTATSGTERWALINSPQNHDVTSAGTLAQTSYYHQYEVSALYSTSDGSTPYQAVILSGTAFGAPSTLTLTTTSQNTWFDINTGWSFNNPIAGAASTERWICTSSNSGTVTSYTVLTPLFYHQYQVSATYSTSDDSTPTYSVMLSGTQSGNPFTLVLTTSTQNAWLDAATAWSVNNPITASSTEQWIATSGTSGTVSSSTAVAPLYYHQYSVSMQYTTSDGSTPSNPVSLSGTQSGSPISVTLTTSIQNVWLDVNSAWSVNNPITASSTEQWIATSGTSGWVYSFTAIDPYYYHQYKVAMSYSTSDGSTPSATVTLSGTQSGNAAFTVTLTTTVQNVWLDATTAWSVNNPITASTTQQWIATSGASGTVSSSTAVAPLYYHQYWVSMNYLTSDLSTPSASVVLSGTQSGNPLTVTLTTTPQRAWLDAATAWSVNNPITASSTEQWIATSGTSGTVTVTLVVAPLYYHQYTATASYSTSDSSTPYSSVVLSGTQSGNTGFTLTLTTSPQTVWLDATTAWSVNNPITAGTQRWDASSGTSGTVTSATTIAPLYYHQYQLTLQYNIANTPAGSPTTTNIVSYTTFGGSATATPALSPATSSQVWADAGTAVTYTSPIVAISGTERWMVTSADSGAYTAVPSVTAASTVNPSYYHQYKASASYSTTDSSTPFSNVVLSGTQFGNSLFTLTLTTTPQAVWLDAGSAWSVNNPINSGNQRWDATSGTSGTISGAATISPNYYHQFLVVFEYTVSGGASGSSAPTAYYTRFGVAQTMTATTGNSANDWVDAGTTVSYTNPLTGSTSSERWQTNLAISSGKSTVSASVGPVTSPINPTYYNQFNEMLSYSTSDSSTPSSIPAFTANQFGSPTAQSLTTTSSPYWFDAGSTWSMTNPIVAGSGTERWQTVQAYTGVLSYTNVVTIAPLYYHQFLMTLEYNIANTPAGSPTVTNIVSYTTFGGAATATPATAPTSKVWADAGSAVKYSSPIVSGSERWIVTSADSGMYTAVSSVTAAATVNPSYYNQFQLTLEYSIANSPPGSPTVTNIVSYTSFGSGQDATPTLAPTATSTAWADAGSAVKYSSPIVSGSERWIVTSADSGTYTAVSSVTAAMVVNPSYYHQFQLTLEYSIANSPAGSPTVTGIVSYTTFGGAATATPTLAPTATSTVWADAGSPVNYNSPIISGSERWMVTSADTGTYTAVSSVTAAAIVNPSYYNQFAVTLSYSVSGGGSPTAPTLTSKAFGVAYTPTLTGTATAYWLDNSATWSVTNPLTGSGNTERWQTSQTVSGTVSAAQTTSFKYYNQYLLTLEYSISNTPAGSPTVTNIVSYTSFGTAGLTATPTLAPTATTTVWADAASAVKYNSPIVSGTERWMVTSGDSGTYTAVSSASASATVNPTYYNQYQISASYSTSDSSTPSASVVLSSTQFGSTSYTLALTTTAQSVWLDAGASWTTNSPIVSGSQQWIASSGTSGTIASGVTVTPVYAHQYQVTFNVSPSGGGSISPSGTQWETVGSVSVTASPNTGYSFSSLSSPTLTVANPTSTSSLVTINGAGTVTANFAVITYPITVTQSSNGAISPASTTVNYGGSKTFSIVPNAGYYISDVQVNGSSVGSPSSYTFRNVYAGQTITASFAPISASAVFTVSATLTSTNTVYSIQVTGNATLSNLTITPYPGNSTTAVTFTITGQDGTTGFINMTLPKSVIPFGTYPIVYIDGQVAPNQGYSQDGSNYYVWFTTHFSTHQVEIEFTTTPPVTPSPTPAPTPVALYYVTIIVVIVVVVIVATVLLIRRRKKSHPAVVEQ